MIDETKFIQIFALSVVAIGLTVGVLMITYLEGGIQ